MFTPAAYSFQEEGLQSKIQGAVIFLDDARYDAARLAWNLTVDQHPDLIVVAATASDVVEAVNYGRSAGLEIAVQATGHGVAKPANGSMLLLTSHMTDVQVDPATQTAWVQAGAKWGRVLEQTQKHGLAPLLGSSPDVGAVGYTLGGGLGWLGRKYGLSSDSVHYFELVTADGRLLHVSGSENSDLFWGLRGGGGSFGIVTGMKIQLYPVTTVYAGNLFYPIEDAQEVLRRYRDWIANVPDELTSSISITNFPPFPDVPEFLRGRSVVIVRGCYVGAMEDGEALLRYWRDWKAPLADMFGPLPFSQVGSISNEPLDPSAALSSSAWLKALDDDAIETLIQYGVTGNGLVVTEVRHVGGAVVHMDAHSSAYSNRDASLIMQVIAMTPTPEIWQDLHSYVEQFKQALAPQLTGGVYINFLDGEERRNRTRDAFTPENFRRLTQLKAKYDPDDLFSHGFDIPVGAGLRDN